MTGDVTAEHTGHRVDYDRRVNLKVLDDFVQEVKLNGINGYEFVEIAKVEQVMVTVANLIGASGRLGLESAIEYIAEKAPELEKDLIHAHTENNSLHQQAASQEEKITELEAELKPFRGQEPFEVLNLSTTDTERITGLLSGAGELLSKVPGGHALARQVLIEVRLLSEAVKVEVVALNDVD